MSVAFSLVSLSIRDATLTHVAQDGVFPPFERADVARDESSGVQADADRHIREFARRIEVARASRIPNAACTAERA